MTLAVALPTPVVTGLNNPAGVAVDSTSLYVSDSGNNRVLKVPVAGGAPIVLLTGLNKPTGVTVDSGGKVQFKNNDTVTHHIMLDDGSGQTADIPPGATSATISIGSNKSYHCAIHPGMVGGFNGSTGDPPPNCSYQYCAGYGGG